MSAQEISNSIAHHAAEILGAGAGAVSGVALFANHSLQPLAVLFTWDNVLMVVFKVAGVIIFSAIGGTVGHFVKRFWERR